MKQIEFLGQTWEVPDWATFITHDFDNSGAVVVWEKMPQFGNGYWSHDTGDWLNPGQAKCVGHVLPKPEIKRIPLED